MNKWSGKTEIPAYFRKQLQTRGLILDTTQSLQVLKGIEERRVIIFGETILHY